MILKRVNSTSRGVQGALIHGYLILMTTLERPRVEDINGSPGVMPYLSCVPRGTYECEKVYSKRFGEVFVLVNPDLGVYKDKMETGRFRCYLGHVAN